jgi:hypothetical protein
MNSTQLKLLILVTACATLLVVISIRRNLRRTRIMLDGDKLGSVCVSQRALHAIIRSTCYSILQTATKLHIDTKIRKNGLDVTIQLQLSCSENVRVIAQKIQSETARCLGEHFGIDKIGSIDVFISGFNA